MRIIFEGISGCGKTTVLESLCSYLDKIGIDYEKIGDLSYETPIRQILLDMVSKAPLMNEQNNFKTSLYESLLLAANHHYVEEKLRAETKLCMYDRHFISLLAYQKEILKEDYINYKKIYDLYKKIVLYNLKDIDYIIYLKVPFDTCIERTEKRDNRRFSEKDIFLLKKIKKNMERELLKIDNGNNVIYLDGMDSIENNIKKIIRKIGVNKNE